MSRRRERAGIYDHALEDLPLDICRPGPGRASSYHLYVVLLRLDEITKTRREVYDHLVEAGVGANVHYFPVHLQPYYRRLGFKRGNFPNAERYYDRAITIPLFPTMSAADQDHVIATLRNALV